MSEESKKDEGLTIKFDREGSRPGKDYERWCRSRRAYLNAQKAKGLGGGIFFARLKALPGFGLDWHG